MDKKTSVSDDDFYPDFCRRAAADDNVFNSFRSNKIYTSIVETVNYRTGEDYLRNAIAQNKWISEYIKDFEISERVGSPQLFKYRYGFLNLQKTLLSPTTTRYIKVLSDLISLFGSLDNKRIIEIGGGYGGLCKIIFDVYNPKSYTLMDLDPCLDLTKKYLDSFEINAVDYKNINADFSDRDFDLVISNYAFSELARGTQDEYVRKIVDKSRAGYMLCNFKTHTWDADQYSENELLNLHANSMLFKMNPALSKIDIQYEVSLIAWGGCLPDKWKLEASTNA